MTRAEFAFVKATARLHKAAAVASHLFWSLGQARESEPEVYIRQLECDFACATADLDVARARLEMLK